MTDVESIKRRFCTTDQLDELVIVLKPPKLLGQLLHGVTGMQAAESTTQHGNCFVGFFVMQQFFSTCSTLRNVN